MKGLAEFESIALEQRAHPLESFSQRLVLRYLTARL